MAEYIVVLEVTDAATEAEAIRSLRTLLKRLLRGHKLRCTDVRPGLSEKTGNQDSGLSKDVQHG